MVVGVHTPEFPFERDVDNVRRAVSEMRVGYPVALDPDYAVWRAFSNHYWPALYIADAEGRIRYHHFGEGAYDECERAIQGLLREAGADGATDDLVSVAPDGHRSAGRLGEPGVAGDLSRSRAGPRSCRTAATSIPDQLSAEPVGAGRGLDDRGAGERAQPGARQRSRSGSTRATSTW